MKFKLLLLPLLVISSTSFASVSVKALANPAVGNHAAQTLISGQATYNITNTSSATQTYHIDVYLCVNNANCTKNHYDFNIASGHTQSATLNLQDFVSLSSGFYEDEATIQVYGYENAQAKGVNTVTVS